MTPLQFLGALALLAVCTLATGNLIFGAVAAFVLWLVFGHAVEFNAKPWTKGRDARKA